ncbi:3'-5' exonuclease [Shouchella clausii]|uniref:3'-5' exonuclease n=1 Tax=Shouchella clausii TaxID=79880 RepID=UPI001C733C6D|nr:3'-5' exonuclease [Shouchella clausii]MBX0320239.1 3'-5' exoribonuclease [Shouchella clausii]MEB5480745.1 3'-5' exoribonuclease [Shouchella clausii]
MGKERTDVMVDIETLGTDIDSTIIQLSAIKFNIETGEPEYDDFHHTFSHTVDLSANKQNNINAETLIWWMKTDPELFKRLLLKGELSSVELMTYFHEWLTNGTSKIDKTLYLWGNGILFDNKIIKHQMEAQGLNYPVYYRNDRDVRTIVDVAATLLGITEEELKEKFNDETLTKHDSLHDVIYQIKLVSYCWRVCTGSVKKWA